MGVTARASKRSLLAKADVETWMRQPMLGDFQVGPIDFGIWVENPGAVSANAGLHPGRLCTRR